MRGLEKNRMGRGQTNRQTDGHADSGENLDQFYYLSTPRDSVSLSKPAYLFSVVLSARVERISGIPNAGLSLNRPLGRFSP